MLTLFPFEAEYYQRHQIQVRFVGHPLADEIPLQTSKQAARMRLNLPPQGVWVALLPGSRRNEVRQLGVPFLQTARWLLTQRSDLQFIVPLANAHLKALFIEQIAILTASGTATLEAMLLKRPMVVAYRMAELTYWLAKWLVHIPYFSLPNLLAQEALVPVEWLDNPNKINELQNRFTELHHQLRCSASQEAANAIFN